MIEWTIITFFLLISKCATIVFYDSAVQILHMWCIHEKKIGGNPLAVLPEAEGLTDKKMQQIAREFNFSESSFVFPPENGNTRKVRIFTPAVEVPFAGHPDIGPASIALKNQNPHTNPDILFGHKLSIIAKPRADISNSPIDIKK